jgi:hypothetical protein
MLHYTVWDISSLHFVIIEIVSPPLSAILQLQEELGYTVAVVYYFSIRVGCHTWLGTYSFFLKEK